MKERALITGASAGIGLELARVFAGHDFDLVLVARNAERLRDLAQDLRDRHGTESRVLPEDLAQPGAAVRISEALNGEPISALVNNAGFGAYGAFTRLDLGHQADMMQVNMTALVQLTHLFALPMVSRRYGRILNVASVAAFQPGPMVNMYYASKAFVFSFSYALANEMEGTGVTVTTLCPGTTRTEFFERGGMHMKRPWPMMEARTVAEAGFRGMMRGKRVVIPGFSNWVMAALSRRMPWRLTSAIVRRVHEGK